MKWVCFQDDLRFAQNNTDQVVHGLLANSRLQPELPGNLFPMREKMAGLSTEGYVIHLVGGLPLAYIKPFYPRRSCALSSLQTLAQDNNCGFNLPIRKHGNAQTGR